MKTLHEAKIENEQILLFRLLFEVESGSDEEWNISLQIDDSLIPIFKDEMDALDFFKDLFYPLAEEFLGLGLNVSIIVRDFQSNLLQTNVNLRKLKEIAEPFVNTQMNFALSQVRLEKRD